MGPAQAGTLCEICTPAANGDLARVEVLVANGADINAMQDGKTPLFFAVDEGKWNVVLWLLDNRAQLKADHPAAVIAYQWAIHEDRPDVVQSLIANHYDVNDAFNGEKVGKVTALQMAFHVPHTAGRDRSIAMLLAAGADPNHHDSDEHTPLDYALDSRYPGNADQLGAIRLLLEAGANPTDALALGNAAILAAADDPDALRLLLAYGAHITQPDKAMAGALAQILAKGDPALVTMLVDSGVSIDVAAPLEKGKPIDLAAPAGKTALALAVEAGDFDRARLLLQMGADPNAGALSNGITIAQLDGLQIAMAQRSARIEALLLDYGADQCRLTLVASSYSRNPPDADDELRVKLGRRLAEVCNYRDEFLAHLPKPNAQADAMPQFPKGSISPGDFQDFLVTTAFIAGTRSQQTVDTILAHSLDSVPAPSPEARHLAALGGALAAKAVRPSQLARAALELEAALRLAPWMDGWLHDACLLENLARLTGRANSSCTAYLAAHPGDTEVKARLTGGPAL